jgi:hypothetical protein
LLDGGTAPGQIVERQLAASPVPDPDARRQRSGDPAGAQLAR